MRKTIKKTLIFILLTIVSALVFTGCKLGLTLDDYINDYDLTATVTYYANEGKFNNNQKVKTVYMAKDSKALNIGVVGVEVGNPITVSYGDDYEFAGWYYAERDGDGEVVYTDETKTAVVLSNQAVDFDVPLGENEDWVVGAKWLKLEVVDVFLVYDDADGITVGETTVKNTEWLREYSFGGSMEVTEPTLAPVDTTTDCTFVAFYEDEACTTLATWPIQRTGTGTNPIIYAKYLKGEWTVTKTNDEMLCLEGKWKILRSANDLYSLFSTVVTGNFYLLNDIDGGGAQHSPISSFSGRLEGNGHTISNVKVASTIRGNGTNRAAMFGDIAATAIIKDVTLKDITVNFTMQAGKSAELYFFCKSVASGATVEDVCLDGGQLNVVLASNNAVYNMNITASAAEGGYLRTKYLFGSYDSATESNLYDTDAEFLAAFTGISFALDAENGNAEVRPELSVPKLDTAN